MVGGREMNESAKLTPSLDLVRSTVETEAAYTLSRLKVLERLPGNPVGAAYRLIEGGAVALIARHLPVPNFNGVVGLRAGQEREIEPLVAWYREHGIKGRFEVVPGLANAAISKELARLDYFQSGFHVSLVCEPSVAEPASADIAVEEVKDAAGLEVFLEAHAAGWKIPDPQGFKANVRGWLHEPGWSLYLARFDGKPAATGILYVRDKVGYCADAATVPAFRGNGLQAALLRRRIVDAGAAGVDFVCSGADYLSTSHRNMERAGMRVQFVRALWTPA
jgi:Acetyltransferase (GNAT) domain